MIDHSSIDMILWSEYERDECRDSLCTHFIAHDVSNIDESILAL